VAHVRCKGPPGAWPSGLPDRPQPAAQRKRPPEPSALRRATAADQLVRQTFRHLSEQPAGALCQDALARTARWSLRTGRVPSITLASPGYRRALQKRTFSRTQSATAPASLTTSAVRGKVTALTLACCRCRLLEGRICNNRHRQSVDTRYYQSRSRHCSQMRRAFRSNKVELANASISGPAHYQAAVTGHLGQCRYKRTVAQGASE
jgi:hypothetical protein